MARRKLSWVMCAMSWPSIRMPSAIDVAEALQHRQHGRLSAARGTDQAGASASGDPKAEILEHPAAAGIGEGHVFERHALEGHASAPWHQRHRLGMFTQVVRLKQGGYGFGEPRHVLRDVDQSHRKVARGMQYGETQGADQHDIARARPAALPQHNRPGQYRHRQHDGERRMQQAQPFEVLQAAAAGAHLAVDGSVEAAVLAADGAEGPDQRHVADDVGQFALDPRGPVGEAVMERRAAGRQPEQQQHDEGGDRQQRRRHRQADRR
jgi:hypothetical protein